MKLFLASIIAFSLLHSSKVSDSNYHIYFNANHHLKLTSCDHKIFVVISIYVDEFADFTSLVSYLGSPFYYKGKQKQKQNIRPAMVRF